MGWFSWFSSTSTQSTAPDRSQRQICWDARDAYFTCLDGAKVLEPGKEGEGVCKGDKKVYEGRCAKSWSKIKYFNEKRVAEEQQRDQKLAMERQAAEAAQRSRR